MKTIMRLLVLSTILIIGSSCQSSESLLSTTQRNPAQTVQVIPTMEVIPSVFTPTITPNPSTLMTITAVPNQVEENLPTSTGNPSNPIMATITPTLIEICSSEPEVSIEMLGLPTQLRLMILPSDSFRGRTTSGLWSISGMDPTPYLIPHTVPETGSTNEIYRLDPTGTWLSYYHALSDDSERVAIISNIGGEQQWQSIAADRATTVRYIGRQEWAVIGLLEDHSSNEDMVPLYIINPFSGHEQSLMPLPEDAVFMDIFVYGDAYYALYFEGNDYIVSRYMLFNYTTNTSQEIYRWLSSDDRSSYFNTKFSFQNTEMGELHSWVFVSRPYGFDMAEGIGIEQMLQSDVYDETMRRVIIPGDYEDTIVGPLIGSDSTIIKRTNVYGLKNDGYIYLFNYDDLTLYDYCLNTEYIHNPYYVSPDGRYLAITLSGSDFDDPNPQGVVILDLVTGYRASLSEWGAVGWGFVNCTDP